MRMLLPVLFITCASASSALAQDCVAYRRATIETCGKAGRLENATLVIRGGKIEAVGQDVKIPEDARVIDAAGCTIMPGILEPYFEITVAGGGDAGQPQTITIRGRTITLPPQMRLPGTAFTRIADNLNLHDPGFRPLVRSGLVGLNVVTSGVGQSALVQLSTAEPEQMLVQPDGRVFASVTNQSESLDAIRTRLDAVARLKRASAASGSGSASSPPAPGTGGAMAQTQLQPWIEVYEGKSPLLVDVANSATVLHLVKLMDTHKEVRWVLFGSGDTFYESLDALRGKPVTVVVTPTVELEPNTRNRMSIARRLHQAEIPFAFTFRAGGGGAGAVRASSELLNSQEFPLFGPAMLVKYGLPRQVALTALTAKPAAILGLDKTHGTIETGKSATLLIFHGDPLDPMSRLESVLIGGKNVHAN